MAPRRIASQQSSAPNSPTTPTHAAYESLSDLVAATTSTPSSPASPRRSHFFPSRHSPTTPTRHTKTWSSPRGEQPPLATTTDADELSLGSSLDGTALGGKQLLSTLDMICLTVGLAGAQLTWTVEMAFGTPYLLGLGLTKQSTSLVWLAGPLSGLLVQPVVGAISDSSHSPYRRRQFIALSSLLVILSTLFVAYARALASMLAALSGLGDWDPAQQDRVKALSIWIGVSGFYVLDFSLNGLQASLRALILDRSPTSQQSVSNAWHGRQTHLGNIFGYLAGYLDLGHAPLLGWVGGGQFRKLAIVSCVVMVVTVGVTCWTQVEDVQEDDGQGEGVRWRNVWGNVRRSIKELPLPVRRVCYVQFFAWTSWFPFLFYSTTYVAETLYSSLPPSAPLPSPDAATRAGSLALLLYALVALAAGALLPFLCTLGRRPIVDRWISRTSRGGRATRWVMAECTPRNCWTAGLVTYAVGMVGTFWVSDVRGAMVVIAWLGVPWAVNCWVPFALVMESIRTLQAPPRSTTSSTYGTTSPTTTRGVAPSSSSAAGGPPSLRPRSAFHQPFRAISSSTVPSTPTRASAGRAAAQAAVSECAPLLSNLQRDLHNSKGLSHRGAQEDYEAQTLASPPTTTEGPAAEAGGTILGIHNLSIVAPQFFVALMAAIIFKLLSASRSSPSSGAGGGGEGDSDPGLRGTNDVVWVLRFGGLAAAMGAVVSRWLIMPGSEREYREWVLAEEVVEGESGREVSD